MIYLTFNKTQEKLDYQKGIDHDCVLFQSSITNVVVKSSLVCLSAVCWLRACFDISSTPFVKLTTMSTSLMDQVCDLSASSCILFMNHSSSVTICHGKMPLLTDKTKQINVAIVPFPSTFIVVLPVVPTLYPSHALVKGITE